MVNDKIYELAKQVGLIEFESIPGSAAVTPDYESVVKAKKFAELIVKECSKVNNQFIGRRIGEIDLDLVYKEHFGVEK